MNILVIYDDTQRTLDFFAQFNPDFDFEYLECTFASSESAAKNLVDNNVFEHIIIAGQSVDKRDMEINKFVPYDFLGYLCQCDLTNTQLHLFSLDDDFLNKGAYIAKALEISISKYPSR